MLSKINKHIFIILKSLVWIIGKISKKEKMILEANEYTTRTFLDFLKNKFKTKINKKDFTKNDVAQYLIRGYTPHRYGNLHLKTYLQEGIKIVKIIDQPELKKQNKK